MKKYLLLLVAILTLSGYAAPRKKEPHLDKAMAERQKKIVNSKREKNRLELIKPMKQGELLTRPTFNSCGFYYGCGEVEDPVLQFRKQGTKEWQLAMTPVHFYENTNTTTGLVMDEYRGSIVKLDENTTYDVRFCDGDKVLKQGKFTTWKTDVPVARTIYIDPATFRAPYTISAKGTPNGWIRYSVRDGKKIVNRSLKTAFIVKDAKYVLIDDMVIDGGKNNRNVITISNSKAVRIRNCEITGWGRVGEQRFDDRGQFYEPRQVKNILNGKKAGSINFDGAIDIKSGSSEVVVERCYIHDPASHANSWFYSHPAGPQAIVCSKPDHSTVIRYNDFIGSDNHRFNDAVESMGNFNTDGGIRRDADVYGNFMIYCNDDNIELDGGQLNVRCFWNRFEAALCGVSIQGCMVSPVYVFENLFSGMCEEFGAGGQTIKTGGGAHGPGAIAFIYNNTFIDRGIGIMMMDTLRSVMKNNVMSGNNKINSLDKAQASYFEANSIENPGRNKILKGMEVKNSKFVAAKTGNFRPVDTGAAVAIPNILPNGGVRGAYQVSGSPSLPYRPVPFDLDATRFTNIVVKNGKATPGELRVTCTVGGKNFKAPYSIRKNFDSDWFTVTPSKGVMKSGDKIVFTVKLLPEKMNKRHDYRGAFLVRLNNGFSRAVSLYAKTDFVQPFKLEKKGDKVYYIDAFKPSKLSSGAKLKTKADPKGVNGKTIVADSNTCYEYKVNIPADGRYYFMIRGYNPKSRTPSISVAVDNDGMETSRQQVKDYMSWTMFTPGRGFGNMCRHYDLKKGEHKIRFELQEGSQFFFDGLLVTTNPGSFEPK